MPRPTETGLNTIRKTLADGTVRAYYYDRKTGKSLGTDRAKALDRIATPAAAASACTPGSIAALIATYRASAAWSKLAPGTRILYGRYLDLIRDEWGDLPVAGFRARFIEKIQDRYRDQPRKANLIVVVLRILMRRAVKLELIAASPIVKPDLLPTRARDQVWSRDDQAEFLDAAPERLRLAFALMLYTLQRPSDVLAMTRGQVMERDGRLFITLRQQKTGELVAAPVHRDLDPLMRARLADNAGGLLLVASPTGRPWSRRNFSRKWDATVRRLALRRARKLFGLGWTKEKVRAELAKQHRQRRDLRRTGVVRMAEAGVTTPQIAALGGWSIDYTQRIVDTYLPRRTEVALAGMLAWEANDAPASSTNVVRLASATPRPRAKGAKRG